jgi:hypothetical protein
MDTFMSEAIILEATLISVLLALWITSAALRGLFWLMSAISSSIMSPMVQPIRVTAGHLQGNRRRNAA